MPYKIQRYLLIPNNIRTKLITNMLFTLHFLGELYDFIMIKCRYSGCLENGNISCKCDYGLRLCAFHYLDHKKNVKKASHDIVLVDELIEECNKKADEILRKIKDIKNSIINKSKVLIKTIHDRLDAIIAQLNSKIHRLEGILIEQKLNNKNYEMLHQNIFIEDKGCDIKSFNEICNNYLRLVINKEEENPPDIEITSFINNRIEFDNLKRTEEILRNNYKLTFKTCETQIEVKAMTKDNKYVGYGDQNYDLNVLDIDKKQPKYRLEGHTDQIEVLEISNDSKYILSGGRDSKIIIWNLTNGNKEAVLSKHCDWVTNIVFTADDKFFISGSRDRTLIIWNLKKKKQEKVLEGHTDCISKVMITKDDKYAVSGSVDGVLIVWNLAKGNTEAILKGNCGWIKSIAVTSDHKYIVSGSADGTLIIWNFIKKIPMYVSKEHSGEFAYVGITSDDKYVVSGSTNKTAIVWDLEKWQKVIFI